MQTRSINRIALAWALGVAVAAPSALANERVIRESEYADRLRAMWLGECIANWTGLRSEGWAITPPFYTDANWGGYFTYVIQDPWGADDDTDIEYVYLHLHAGAPPGPLSPLAIQQGWRTHVNRFIWVSNASARALMERGVRPPSTGIASANPNRLMIDAQLTTEFFGALCPGMPVAALELADLPIRATASGYAAHAAQFYVVLYSLATQVPQGLSPRDRNIWLVQQARAYLPSTSKASDVVDFVLADYLANPDPDDWESTRDKVYQRYQANASANGFVYRAWYESSVNFATGLIALLYGEGDFKRTVRIGMLSGWDSDNGTATMGGLVSLMIGTQALRDQFPGVTLSDRFDIYRTRDALPDYLPTDAGAQDTFTLMAQRMLAIIRANIAAQGGVVDAASGLWALPPLEPGTAILQSPTHREDLRSANNRVRRLGGLVTASSSIPPNSPAGTGDNVPARFGNGLETGFDGREESNADAIAYTSYNAGLSPSEVVLGVTYDRPAEVHTIRFIEGDHFGWGTSSGVRGGWFESLSAEVLLAGVWTPVPTTPSEPLDPSRPFQIIDLQLDAPALATGVRVRGVPGGASKFVTCSELDALSAPTPRPRATFDLNADGAVDLEDLHAWNSQPTDLTADGVVDGADRACLTRAIRLGEENRLTSTRP